MDYMELNDAFEKGKIIIEKCENKEHLQGAKNYIISFSERYEKEKTLTEILNVLFEFQKEKIEKKL